MKKRIFALLFILLLVSNTSANMNMGSTYFQSINMILELDDKIIRQIKRIRKRVKVKCYLNFLRIKRQFKEYVFRYILMNFNTDLQKVRLLE